MSAATDRAKEIQNAAVVDDGPSAVPDVLMEAAGCQSDATMLDVAPQSSQDSEMEDILAIG